MTTGIVSLCAIRIIICYYLLLLLGINAAKKSRRILVDLVFAVKGIVGQS